VDSQNLALPPEHLCWFAVICKPRQESIALENLQRQKFHCFLPMVDKPAGKSARRKSARRKSMAEPLFPGYLFLQADSARHNLAPVRSTRGVQQMMRFGIKLAVVPDPVIQYLKSRVDENGLIPLTPDYLKAGDKVRVLDGALAGLHGIFTEQNKEARAILLMNILGRQTKVQIDPRRLERVGVKGA